MREDARQPGDADRMQLWAGQAARLARAEPAGSIALQLWKDASGSSCDHLAFAVRRKLFPAGAVNGRFALIIGQMIDLHAAIPINCRESTTPGGRRVVHSFRIDRRWGASRPASARAQS
jgi:hypothetical protein